MSVSQRGGRGGRDDACGRAHRPLHKRDYADGLVDLARQAGAADPELLGNQIALLYEGASALSTSLNDPTPWARARAAA